MDTQHNLSSNVLQEEKNTDPKDNQSRLFNEEHMDKLKNMENIQYALQDSPDQLNNQGTHRKIAKASRPISVISAVSIVSIDYEEPDARASCSQDISTNSPLDPEDPKQHNPNNEAPSAQHIPDVESIGSNSSKHLTRKPDAPWR